MMNPFYQVLRGITLMLLLTLGFSTAHAFERTRDPSTSVCLWWNNRWIIFRINQACSKDVTTTNCLNAVKDSYLAWRQNCTDLQINDGGTTARSDIGFDSDHWTENINLILWREDRWEELDPAGSSPEEKHHAASAIALTTTTYDRNTGEIVDADIELNGKYFEFAIVGASPSSGMDIQNTLVHELGHAIGLDHTNDKDACMYSTAQHGETKKRDLAPDDINGICKVYPVAQDTLLCSGGNNSDPGCACIQMFDVRSSFGIWMMLGGLWLYRIHRRRV